MLTEQMLRRSPALAALNPVAAAHHEKTNGSGYHKGLRADAVDRAASVLAAADIYVASPPTALIVPHSPARTPQPSFAGSHPKARSSTARPTPCWRRPATASRSPSPTDPSTPADSPAARPRRYAWRRRRPVAMQHALAG
jgi:HD domain